jgi:hypothetical protein
VTEQPTEYAMPKSQAQIDELLTASFAWAALPSCEECGAIVRHTRHSICFPCGHANRGNWVPHPASVTVRPRAAIFSDAPERHGEPILGASEPETNLAPIPSKSEREMLAWDQATAYAADLATLNAQWVRARGLLVACLPTAPPHLRAHIERELAVEQR